LEETTSDSVPDKSISGLLAPGFVDLQVNGGGGTLLNNSPDQQGILDTVSAHRKLGTKALMPTVITDKPAVMESAAHAVIESRSVPGVIGLHIEGPHISLEKRGTHAAEFLRPMDANTLEVVSRLRNNDIPVLITVAPEATTPEQIGTLVELGAVVSIGHTNANQQDVTAAINAGANCATHLYNAMSPMSAREPGAVGTVINAGIYAGIICDGHHVADDMIELAYRARPMEDRLFLVSDAMPTFGGPSQFELYGNTIKLQEGRLVNQEGNLAGAHTCQLYGLQRLVNQVGIPLASALKMVTSIPAACIGLPQLGKLVDRSLDELIVLDPHLNLCNSPEQFV